MLRELKDLVALCDASILYQPLKGEVDYHNRAFPFDIPLNILTLPNHKDSDPFAWAAKCTTKFKDTKPFILIPGTRFDIRGTRHGKGGGWYDRFLAKVPTEWLRIGVANKSQMSETELLRQEWDQLVDWIIVCDSFNLTKVNKASKMWG